MSELPFFSAVPVPVKAPEEKHLTRNRSFQGIPGIAVLPSGRLFAVCYSGGSWEGRENFVVLFVSDDGGKHWSDVVAVVDPPQEDVRAFDPVLWLSPEKRLFLFWAQSYSDLLSSQVFDGVGGVWCAELENPDSSPGNFRWTSPRRIAHGIMMNKPLVLSDGRWALPCSVWQSYRTRPDGMEPFRGAGLWASSDHGKSFVFRGRAVVREGFSCDEHIFWERRDGSLQCLIRTTYGLAESFSRDGGYTWSDPVPSSIPGPNSRFFLMRLASGSLLLLNHRNEPGKRERNNLAAFLSKDDGRTWGPGLLLDGRMGVSYPDAVQAEDGTIYAVYDYQRRHGTILLARFTEEDVKAEKLLNKESFLAMTVNAVPQEP
ncbi:MAG: exo-alpha-sialidase [Lentisphaeria bacterium]|nr:exo-alpha-sialidase [Lentisphaeria bacterium]